ncbi:peptidyl-lysine (3S)-dioxygenase / protease [Geosmithia morbida]|uniref:Peptidyl-lysine (3S)-dioxygenase / protease n=1 Tax=Geosmithia morbida TaxID=1094350 RepID=A0A9P5CZ75_9HYPO|nr:peptidyl-lysine (3S)-dioxygenase / protease [Geosmithia morbida]KAF4120152.1 peptidyl-lysine (3S)-dioxygenase / protease [Geosmithia morbida]
MADDDNATRAAAVANALTELITDFNDLNGAAIDELSEEPSPLEFMRYVARNTPFVVRQGARDWKATRRWSPAYLNQVLGTRPVNVAVTPKGNADAPTFSPTHGTRVISKPHEEEQPFNEFLDHVIRQETDTDFPKEAEVRYAQSQNDNFRNEYMSLFSDAQKDIAFARIALQKDPEAINMWIGNSQSVTALHRDPMENIYVQIIGQKHFVLLSPLCHACVNERLLAPATYSRSEGGFDLRIDDDSEPVPLATWDPDDPQINTTEFSHLAQPIRVTLDPGDMMYLPAMWYHKVKQSSTEQGCVVAVNYW